MKKTLAILSFYFPILFGICCESCKKDIDIKRSLCEASALNSTHENRAGILLPDTIIIPVVVHVVYNVPEQNIPDAQIFSQIEVLNEDFNARNANINSVPLAFKSRIGVSNIWFVLAKRTPNNLPTNGITRTQTSVTVFGSGGGVCYVNQGGVAAWNPSQYLNIWVCNKTGAAGYSSYPWSGNAATDGIIISYNYFGRVGAFTNNWNYTSGRTCTHEAGHWLGLAHTWADAVCGDDLVYDTPVQYGANGSCPAYPHTSACNSSGEMTMNFMDYTYDGCKCMFTEGQKRRMWKTIAGYRPYLITSKGAIAV